jgi:septum site-determining protein MinC
MSDKLFQLKGSVLTTLILELVHFEPEEFRLQLCEKIDSAPGFFLQSPVVISLEQMPLSDVKFDPMELIEICREKGLQPIAFKFVPSFLTDTLKATGLAIISDNARKSETGPTKPAAKSARIIDKTVRSGQQIYADGSDLIILGSVSGGAEVLADGNIHIYGSLRGRALAGVQGNLDARIFCSRTEAELASIAGHFLLSDAIAKMAWQQPAQFYLQDETLHVSALS